MVNLLPSPEPTPLSAEDRYRLLAENSSDIVYQTAGLNIIWISPSVTAVLGWEEADLIGQPAQKLVSSHQDLSWIVKNRMELEQGHDVAQEMLLTAKNGNELWFSGIAHPVHGDGGDLEGFVVGDRGHHGCEGRVAVRSAKVRLGTDPRVEKHERLTAVRGIISELQDRWASAGVTNNYSRGNLFMIEDGSEVVGVLLYVVATLWRFGGAVTASVYGEDAVSL